MNALTLNPEYDRQLEAGWDKREAALRAGDADAWHLADSEVQSALAAMRAEVALGIRPDPMFTVECTQ